MERLATLCGAVADSFEKGAELLQEDGRDSVERIDRRADHRGHRRADRAGTCRRVGPSAAKSRGTGIRDACGRTVGYIGIDATGVRQQGPRGEKAEGRMAYVGMIFNPCRIASVCSRACPSRASRCGRGTSAACTRWRKWVRCYAGKGPRWVWIGPRCGWQSRDGGAGLEDFVRENFPRVEAVILDFYHAAEYLAKLARR